MLVVPVVLKKSLIQGKGIFAKEEIKKGSVIVRIGQKERYYSKEQYRKFSSRYKKTLDKFAYWDKNKNRLVYSLDYTKYFNHSCEPNVLNRGSLDLAAKDIRKGEELTYNYQPILTRGEQLKCNCGSKHCKKLIKSNS